MRFKVADQTKFPDVAIPNASIIVPSYNRPERLRRCLSALVAQEGVNFEIVVVDDGSDQSLEPICASFGSTVRCLRQENAGPAAARNLGANAAMGSFLAFTDDDCMPRPNWLSNLVQAHAGQSQRLVGGYVANGLPDDHYAHTSQLLCDFLYEYFGASDGTMPFFTSNNMGCSRERFIETGGFDESFPLAAAEDREFGMRWRAKGGELLYGPNAVIDHMHGMTFGGFWRQHQGYGRGARHLHTVLESQKKQRPRFESLRFYFGLLWFPIGKLGLRGLPFSFLMGLTQVAMVSGYVLDMFWGTKSGAKVADTAVTTVRVDPIGHQR